MLERCDPPAFTLRQVRVRRDFLQQNHLRRPTSYSEIPYPLSALAEPLLDWLRVLEVPSDRRLCGLTDIPHPIGLDRIAQAVDQPARSALPSTDQDRVWGVFGCCGRSGGRAAWRPERRRAANSVRLRYFWNSRGGTRTRDPGIMSHGHSLWRHSPIILSIDREGQRGTAIPPLMVAPMVAVQHRHFPSPARFTDSSRAVAMASHRSRSSFFGKNWP